MSTRKPSSSALAGHGARVAHRDLIGEDDRRGITPRLIGRRTLVDRDCGAALKGQLQPFEADRNAGDHLKGTWEAKRDAQPAGALIGYEIGHHDGLAVRRTTVANRTVSDLRLAWPGNLVPAEQKYVVNSRVTAPGSFLPQNTRDAIASGTWNKVPVLIGNVRNENRLLSLNQYKITGDQYTQYVQSTYGAAAPDVLADSRAGVTPSPLTTRVIIRTPGSTTARSRRL